jgi:hypothetical protein
MSRVRFALLRSSGSSGGRAAAEVMVTCNVQLWERPYCLKQLIHFFSRVSPVRWSVIRTLTIVYLIQFQTTEMPKSQGRRREM